MRGWLLDTNAVSELRRPKPEPNVVRFISEKPLDALFLTSVTIAEIRFGIERVDNAERRAELVTWLDSQLRPMFEGRIIEASEDVLLRWRVIIEAGRKSGHTFSHPDVLIAAAAAHHNLVVVTRNVGEFVAAGVAVEDPWTGRRVTARI